MVKRPAGLVYDERDIDAVVRTMLGEAAGEGDDGLAAVAHVLVNRYEKGGYGGSLYSVAHAKKQFSAWNSSANGGNGLVKVAADDPRYVKARAVAEQVLNGRHADNTGGATHYFAPKGMTGKNGTVKGAPSWAKAMGYTASIGGHKFYSADSAAGAAEGLANGGSLASVQQQLAERGFSPGAIDGVRGPKTDAAIKAFQQANGLTVDGIVGPKTRAALESNRVGGYDALSAIKDRNELRKPLQAPAPLSAPSPYQTLPPPTLPLNSPLPPMTRSAQYGPLTSQWGPKVNELGPPPFPPDAPKFQPNMMGRGLPPIPDMSAGAIRTVGPAGSVALPPGFRPDVPALPGSFDPRMMGRGLPPVPAQPSAPMPMQRPFAPPAPPVPTQRPMDQSTPQVASASQAPSQHTVRLPSGKMIAPGTYPGSGGRMVTISDDGSGNAVIQHPQSGLIDIGREAGAPTIVGGMIRAKIPEAIQSAMPQMGHMADNVKSAAADAVSNLGTNFGNMFGGLFGQHPPVPQFQPGMFGRGQPSRSVAPPIPFRRPAIPLPTIPAPSSPPDGSSHHSAGSTAYTRFFDTGFD